MDKCRVRRGTVGADQPDDDDRLRCLRTFGY
jgi:hypothetical protein